MVWGWWMMGVEGLRKKEKEEKEIMDTENSVLGWGRGMRGSERG